MKSKMGVQVGSGNVFKDLNVSQPEEMLAKAALAAQIALALSARGLTQGAAATLLGIDQPKVSALLRGRLSGFSTDRLLRFLTALGRDVEIVIREKGRRSSGFGHLQVRSA